MPALPELQQSFAAAILAGDMAPLAAEIAPVRLGAARRAAIYRNHFAISLGEALAATFPVLQRLVGEAYFAQAADRFVAAAPPTSPVLFEYGEAFPSYLAGRAGADAFAYLVDVGAFEWAIQAKRPGQRLLGAVPHIHHDSSRAGYSRPRYQPIRRRASPTRSLIASLPRPGVPSSPSALPRAHRAKAR